MQSQLNIPKKIHVGFQKRGGTYTGKLAYIVYTDEKGVLRKERSWNEWRDHKIESKDFDNVPTSGFVLNKKAGGYGSGWHHRQAKIRIYDPRDFEFEISIENHLFILEETSSIKGKGLEGEFVYSWDGSDLVLLPVSSQEYKSSSQFSDLKTKKVNKSDIKEGYVFLNKDQKQVMYLGRHNWHEYVDNYDKRDFADKGKLHIFVSLDGKSVYWPQKGFTKLAARIGDDPSPQFANEYEKFKHSVHSILPDKLVPVPAPVTVNDFKGPSHYSTAYRFIKKDDNFYRFQLVSQASDEEDDIAASQDSSGQVAVKARSYYAVRDKRPIQFKNGKISGLGYETLSERDITEEDLPKLDLYLLYLENEKGGRLQVKNHEWSDNELEDDFED